MPDACAMNPSRDSLAVGAEARLALAVMAAVAGTGYASGREMVLFFAQLGRAAWVGIFVASALFGILAGVLCRWACRSTSDSVAGVIRRQLGRGAGRAAELLHALLMSTIAAVMLSTAGEMGALALPVRHGCLWGAALAMMIALSVNLGGLRALPWLGLLTAALGAIFYAGLAIDLRPVRVYLREETALALRGSPWAAILLALLYASMNACLAGGVIVRFSSEDRLSPTRFAAQSGALLCALLLCANAAIARGGDPLLSQAMPVVILAARWGTAGFWLSAGFRFLCAAATLTAALGALLVQMGEGGRQRRSALMMMALAALIFACLGLPGTVWSG